MLIKNFKDSLILNLNFYRNCEQLSLFRLFRLFIGSVFFYAFAVYGLDGMGSVDDLLNLSRSYFNDDFPTFVIQDGEISSSLNQPYVSPNVNHFRIVVDTTGAIQDLGPDVPSGLLVKRDSILFKKDFRRKTWFDARKISELIGPFTVDNTKLEEWRPIIYAITFPLFAGIIASTSLAINLGLILLIGFCFYLRARFYKLDIRYSKLVIISLLSLFPALLVSFVMQWVGLATFAAFIARVVVMILYGNRVLMDLRAHELSHHSQS